MSADAKRDPDQNRPKASAAGAGTGRPDGHSERDRNPQPRRDAQGRVIEVPGRPDADEQTDRDKAYGPGGARPAMNEGHTSKSRADEAAPDEAGDGAARTGQGADTKPM